jgi:hypothetical protein
LQARQHNADAHVTSWQIGPERAKVAYILIDGHTTSIKPGTFALSQKSGMRYLWHCQNLIESANNEASRYKLRLQPGGYLVGIAVALPWLWQDCNHEGVDARRRLRR